jgi:hypothetical protein
MRIVVSLVAGALLAGCSVYSNPSYPAEPDRVHLDDGVYVLADYPEPVFFSAGMYWRYDDGYWYRSRVHTGNWSRVHRPPTAIRRIDRPETYVRYRPGHRAGSPMTRREDDRAREREQEARERAQERREEAREREQEARERAREQREEQRGREQEMRDEAREHDKEMRRQEREQRDEARERDKDRDDD